MLLSSRPLISARDSELYVPRPGIDEPLRRAIDARLNALVTGPRGAGKTSSVTQAVISCGAEVGVVNASIAASVEDLINLIADSLGAGLPVGERAAQLARLAAPSRSLASKVAVLRVDEPMTIVIDNLVSAQIASALFGGLRDELWATGVNFVVVAQPEATPPLLSPPADAFFDVRVSLGPLETDAQKDLLARRQVQETALALDSGPQLPRDLLARARAVEFDEASVARAASAVRDLNDSQRRAVEALRRIHRPVFAGDDELLQEVGVSRAQMGRILMRLEDQGLVQSFRAEAGGVGRPPQMFVLTDMAAAA